MKKVYDIYDISNGYGIYTQTVTKEIAAKLICRQHNKKELNYVYLKRYE